MSRLAGYVQVLVATVAIGLVAGSGSARAGTAYNATPANYRTLVGKLKAGDTLNLAAGTYKSQLAINGLAGTEAAWITIQGPSSGPAAVFEANGSENTVQIHGSCYVAIKYLTLDGKGLDGPDGIKAGGGTNPPVHHILVEGCTIKDYSGSQQSVGISTKTATWGWIIRGNRVIHAGTGLYLGNSDGSHPFVAGIIEGNLVKDPIGYCMEIKYQNPRSEVKGMPTEASRTIVRHNVFIKGDGPSPDGDRPNLLVGNFPDSGPGSEDVYEIYGNFLFHNPRESLLQACGRASIHDNVFVDVAGTAICLQRSRGHALKRIFVYNNTIYGAGTGISFDSSSKENAVIGNLIFAGTPIRGAAANKKDNVAEAAAGAGQLVKSPSKKLGEMDFTPLAGKCLAAVALDLSAFAGDTDYTLDFNGSPKGELRFVGAYAGDGPNRGWALKEDLKSAAAQPGLVAVRPEPKPEPRPEPKAEPKPTTKEAPPAPPAPPPAPVERTPDQICQSWFATANNYVRAGLNDKASEYFTKIVEKYPGSEWAGKARAELAKL